MPKEKLRPYIEQITEKWNTRESSWIKITPETMPKDKKAYIWVNNDPAAGGGTYKNMLLGPVEDYGNVHGFVFTHYMPTSELPKGGE